MRVCLTLTDDSKECYLYRALSFSEVPQKSEDRCFTAHRGRGYFPEIMTEQESLHDIVFTLFNHIRLTANNLSTSDRLFSYSKTMVVPLFKYNKHAWGFGFKKESINIAYAIAHCFYYQWVKGAYSFPWEDNDDHSYSSESEMILPLKQILSFRHSSNVNGLSEYFKQFHKEHKFIPFGYFLKDYLDDMRNNEELQLEQADLDSIDSLTITGFSLDISVIPRKLLNEFLEVCLEEPKIVRRASFNKDREVISTEPFYYSPDSMHFTDKEQLNYLRLIVLLKLFLFHFESKLRSEHWHIINNYSDSFIDFKFKGKDKQVLDILLKQLKDNVHEEYSALNEIGVLYVYPHRFIQDEYDYLFAILNQFLPQNNFIHDVKNLLQTKNS